MTTKISSLEFKKNPSRAKEATKFGPVYITYRGKPTHVLVAAEDYEKLMDGQRNVVDLLAMSEGLDFEFDPLHLKDGLYRPADLV